MTAPTSSESASFLFAICQRGAEEALKLEFNRNWPKFRLAYSRPGFVTFKVPDDQRLVGLDLKSTFARTWGVSLGKVQGSHADTMAEELWSQLGDQQFDQLHVWQRDCNLPGERGFEPGISALATAVGEQISQRRPQAEKLAVNRLAGRGQRVLDCVIVEPAEWWFGFHTVNSRVSRWPGGVPFRPAQEVVSRSYLKIREALAWSQFPLQRGELCAEIGSAPGGASQALLQSGLQVIGIDPAEMDPSVLAHPQFTHIRKRAADMRRREFRAVKWLIADSNVAPNHTLDSVESIVTHQQVHIRGLILTLKLPDWSLVDDIAGYVERVRGWGFQYVRTRQLAFNRREFCLAALRSKVQKRVAEAARGS